MKPSRHDRRLQALSIAFAAVPFAFALTRAFETGWQDLRYVWVALAGLCGATLIRVVARPYDSNRATAAAALSAAVFMSATLLAVIAGVLLGTTLGPGLWVVGSAFGLCFAAGSLLHVRERT